MSVYYPMPEEHDSETARWVPLAQRYHVGEIVTILGVEHVIVGRSPFHNMRDGEQGADYLVAPLPDEWFAG